MFPAALTSRMKGCRGVLRELPAATSGRERVYSGGKEAACEREVKRERRRDRDRAESELRRGCLQFPSNFVGNLVVILR